MKKTTEETDSSESSDDDFVNKSIAHVRIKRLQDVSQPKRNFNFLQYKNNRTRQSYQLESEPWVRLNDGQKEIIRSLELKHEEKLTQLRFELEKQRKSFEVKLEQSMKMLTHKINEMTGKQNHNSVDYRHLDLPTQTARVEESCFESQTTDFKNLTGGNVPFPEPQTKTNLI